MRPPWRAVGDDDVDRPQVGARRRVEPSGTNGPSASVPCADAHRESVFLCLLSPIRLRPQRDKRRPLRGGAPLPIPNREVKPRRGDDTAGDRGKVARRPPTTETPTVKTAGVCCFYGPALPFPNLSFIYIPPFPNFYYFYSQIRKYGQKIGICVYFTDYQLFRIFTKSYAR